MRLGPRGDDGATDLEAHFADHAEDVAYRRVGVWPHDEVRSRQSIEMRDVAVDVVRVVVHVAQLLGQRSDLAAEAAVDGLGAGHMVTGRADAADAGHDARQLLDRPPYDETFEPAQLGDLEEAILDSAVVAEKNLDLAVALEAGDGVDADLPRHCRMLLCSSEDGTP